MSALEALIEEHNTLVTERNAIAAAYSDLVEQITTTIEAIPSS